MDKFNLDLKVKGETGAKPTKEYLEAIETKINDIIETKEETLTFDSESINASVAKVIKRNNLVFLQMVVENTKNAIAAETTLTTIPSGFRPKFDTRLIASISGATITAEIKSSGKIVLKSEFAKSKWLSFTITYFI